MRVFAITGPIGSSIKKFSQQFADKISLKMKVTILDESDFLVEKTVVTEKDAEKDAEKDVATAEKDKPAIPAEYDKNKPVDYARLKTVISSTSGIVIVRGNYLFADESLRELFNVKVFVSADGDTCLTNYLQNIKPTEVAVRAVLDFYEQDIKVKNDEQINKLEKYADISIPEAKIGGPALRVLLDSVDGLYPKEDNHNFFTAPATTTGPEGSISSTPEISSTDGINIKPQEPDESSLSLLHQGAF